MQALDTTRYYRLNPSEHPRVYLGIRDVDTAWEPILVGEWNATQIALNFTVAPSATASQRVNICCDIASKSYCLDQWGNNASEAALQQPGPVSGQQWLLNEWMDANTSRSSWTLYSDYAGTSRPLSVIIGDTPDADQVVMSNQDGTESEWIFEEVGKVASADNNASDTTLTTSQTESTTSLTESPTTVTTTSSVSSTTSAATLSGSADGLSPYTSGLGAGAKAGIAVGVVLAFLLFVWGAWFGLRRRRRKKRQSLPELDGVTASESKNLTSDEKDSTGSSPNRAELPSDSISYELSAEAATGGQRSELPTKTLVREV